MNGGKMYDGLRVRAKGAFARGLRDGCVYTLKKSKPDGNVDTYDFIAGGKTVARFDAYQVGRFLSSGEDANGLEILLAVAEK